MKDSNTLETYEPGGQFNADANTILWAEYFNSEKKLKESYIQKQELVFQ